MKAQGWRKIAAATWGHPNDPQIYGDLEVDAGALTQFVEDARRVTGTRVTVTHVVGKALAHALAENPDLNTRLYRGRFIPRDSVDIFFVVSTGEGRDLSGVKVWNTDQKPVVEIAEELARRAAKIRAGEDADLGRTKTMLAAMPTRLLSVSMRLAAWLTADRNIDLKRYGLPRQAFGSAMVTSVGMFGVQHAYAPLSPYYRIPFLALVGEITPRAVVVDGEVVARPVLTVSATMDHRYFDGAQAARLGRGVRAYLEGPQAFEPPLEPGGDSPIP